MRQNQRSNPLLVELLIVVLFFMLAAGVLLQVFGKARQLSTNAEAAARATAQAQNLADRLYAAAEPEAFLEAEGFMLRQDQWELEQEGLRFAVTVREEALSAGVMRRQQVSVYQADQLLISFPCSRYMEVAR